MYPLKVVLIGGDEYLLPSLRKELLNVSADLVAEFPDIPSAIGGIELRHDETRLFIVHLSDERQLHELRHLNGVFSHRPILALVDGEPSSSFLVHAMRDGATQVVSLPLDSQDFREAFDSIGLQFGHAATHSLVIGVTGGYGGAGATTVAVNLAYEIAQEFNLDSLLIEMNPHVGVLPALLNVQPQWSVRELLAMSDRLDIYVVQKACVPIAERLAAITGPCHVGETSDISSSDVGRLVECARQVTNVVVLDVPSTLDGWQMQALDVCDEVVLVGEQTIPSLHLMMESLRLGIRSHAPRIVVNRFDSKLEGLDAVHLQRVLGVEELHTISSDREGMLHSINRGQPLRLIAPHSPVLKDIDRLALTLLGKRIDPKKHKQKHKADVFHRLAHALGVG